MTPSFLRGERIDLRPLAEADADGPYVSWFNDAETCRGNSHHVRPYSAADARAYIAHVAAAPDQLVLAIVRREDGRHIGNIALQAINPVYRTAELSIMLGERDAWGQGYASEAARLLCDHGFRALNLNRIACGTFAPNGGMRRVAERLGMREEGVRRQAAFKDGAYVDVVEYGVLRAEYESARVAAESREAA
jgi:[ribosomal protein S5]-alanine N-acetyltransferase